MPKKQRKRPNEKLKMYDFIDKKYAKHRGIIFNHIRHFQDVQGDAIEEPDVSSGKYGNYKLLQSSEKRPDIVFTPFKDLTPEIKDKTVWLRGRLHTSRGKGKFASSIKGNVKLIIFFFF